MQLRPLSPSRYWRAAKRLIVARLSEPSPVGSDSSRGVTPVTTYADLYEGHASALPPDASIGDGDFDMIGIAELAILTDAGLRPTSSLLDFGCGTGRLAVHAVPFLAAGTYVGTDIAPTMLRHAAGLLERRLGAVPPNTRFVVQPDEAFPVTDPPDVICAYSVFTHMEHEDMFRYLVAARQVSHPATVFVASCLQIELDHPQRIFRTSAALPLDQRWHEVRNVVTSRELFTAVAAMAGWTVDTWLRGDEPAGTLPDGTMTGIGQSIAVMTPTA